MCGIAGWNLTEKPSLVFVLTLAAQIEERGRDSFGFYNGETKEVYKAKDAITAKLPASRLQFSHGFFHTRHATTGLKTVENSHPFEIGDVIGAHNGVVHNDREMELKYGRNFDVDSMHIFAHIAEGRSTKELEGYGAIEYIRDGKYFVGRCNHGNLEIALTDKGVIWASTTEAIDAAIYQAGYTLKHYYRVDQGKVYHVAAESLYETEHSFKMREHVYAPVSKTYFPHASEVSKTGIREQDKRDGTSDNMTQWERDLEREDKKKDGSLFVLSKNIQGYHCYVAEDFGHTDNIEDARLFDSYADARDFAFDGETVEEIADTFHTEPVFNMPEGSPIATMDICHWCGEYKLVAAIDDGSLACADCADYLEEMDEQDIKALKREDAELDAKFERAVCASEGALTNETETGITDSDIPF